MVSGPDIDGAKALLVALGQRSRSSFQKSMNFLGFFSYAS